MSKILSGIAVQDAIAKKLIAKIGRYSLRPKLAIIQIGEEEESSIYIHHKKRFAEKLGIAVEHKKYPPSVSGNRVVSDIKKYNRNSSVHGIVVQLPIPARLNKSRIIEAIDPRKDVDGLTAGTMKFLFDDEAGFVTAATKAVLALLEYYRISISGKKAVMVGDSSLVGKPTALALLNRNATVTVCHRYTKNLKEETKRADILVVAIGRPKFITEKFVSAGQTVIDVGITAVSTRKKNGQRSVAGDVDYKKVKAKVGAITPVPGGVGPVTIACLFENVVEACILQNRMYN